MLALIFRNPAQKRAWLIGPHLRIKRRLDAGQNVGVGFPHPIFGRRVFGEPPAEFGVDDAAIDALSGFGGFGCDDLILGCKASCLKGANHTSIEIFPRIEIF